MTNASIHPNGVEPKTSGNAIIDSLQPDISRALEREGESVLLGKNVELLTFGEIFEFVYFPYTCLLSKVSRLEDGRSIEVGIIGRDGFAGLPAAMGITTADATITVQIPGTALRLSAKVLGNYLHHPGVREALGEYVVRSMAETTRELACVAYHPAARRLANWLLRVQDILGSDNVDLTQDVLGTMLGNYRPTVTVAAGELRDTGLISYRYGKLKILDRAGLEKAACGCFRVVSKFR